LYLYQKQVSDYVLVSESSSSGKIVGTFPRIACQAWVELKIPSAGDYKLIAQSKHLLGSKIDVGLFFEPAP
jgi:hypothetical protein